MQECDAGKYNDVAGSDAETQCKECDAGKYNSEAGSGAKSACKDCDQVSTTMRPELC